ncbi:MAG: hypothetical protein RI580_08120 [Halothece sp. Uz-M2-17]|nr:hypothetical protein [Halothece sp. Uz-M2-17]
MNQQSAIGTSLVFSNSLANVAANAVGVAKTGSAIGSLHGIAHTSATAAWVGFGSMKLGMCMMGVFPVIGAALLLDSLCSQEYSSPIIDWYEEAWTNYEAECELQDLKKEVKIDRDHQLQAKKVPASLAQLDHQFYALEVEDELYQMKKQIDGKHLASPIIKQSTSQKQTEKLSFDYPEQEVEYVQKVIKKALAFDGVKEVITNWKGEKRVALGSGMMIEEKGNNVHIFSPKLAKMLILSDQSIESLSESYLV